jgi:hypothetical protein
MSEAEVVKEVTPNKEQVISLIRNLFAVFGGYLISTGLTNSATLESGTGFAVALAAMIFSFRAHELTINALLSVLRSGIATFGGVLVQRGWATNDQVSQVANLLVVLLPMAWGIATRAKTSLTPAAAAAGKVIVISPIPKEPTV